MKLYSFFRSSAAYRVRIALNLKGLTYDYLPVHLSRGGGEQHDGKATHESLIRVTNRSSALPGRAPHQTCPILVKSRTARRLPQRWKSAQKGD